MIIRSKDFRTRDDINDWLSFPPNVNVQIVNIETLQNQQVSDILRVWYHG